MTANISCVLQPVDQEKLPAPMSHFDSLAETPMPRGKIKSEIGPAIGKNRHKDPPTPPAPVLKIQKSDLFCVGNFFASSLFRAALTLIERRPDVRFTIAKH